MELFRQLDDGQINGQTIGLTELFLKSLSRLKISIKIQIKIRFFRIMNF